MQRMSTQMETVVNAYKTLAKVPSLVGARLNNAGTRISSKWSVRNLDKGKMSKFAYDYIIDDKFNVVAESEFGVDVSNELLTAVSPTEKLRAVIREQGDSKETKKFFLEVWRSKLLEHSVDLSSLDLHGDVYADSEFGSLDWTPDESALVYIAEKKPAKSEPFIKRKPAKTSNGDNASDTVKGEEYLYKEDWGEQLVGKHFSVIVVFKLATETCSILEGLPETCCPGQVRCTPDGAGVVCVAWETARPRRLGLIFCTNRPSTLVHITFDGQCTTVSEKGHSVRSPRFDAQGKRLYWLQRPSGGPHHACHQLVYAPWPGLQSGIHTVIDIVGTKIMADNGVEFTGIYSQALPGKCLAADSERLVFSTPQSTEVKPFAVDVGAGRLTCLWNKSGSLSVLDVKGDLVLGHKTDLTSPSQLMIARLPKAGLEAEILWVPVGTETQVPAPVKMSKVECVTLKHDDSAEVNSFSAIYMGPAHTEPESKVPLIVWPHGGPHSNFVNAYSLEASLFRLLGFATLQINYRGSTGSGQKAVESILKLVGEQDVKDCMFAADEAVKRFPVDAKKRCLYGGSHGGFLVTHLSGQYPDAFAAVVTRNPVTDIASMINSTDIPDCGVWRVLGMATLMINFRGSTGQGEKCVHSLLEHLGDYDVKDSLLAIDYVKRKYPIDKTVLFGKSYGGLVAAHLAGMYPSLPTAVVLRCPLIDLATKYNYADNPDTCAIEAGFEFSERGPASEEMLVAMRRASPLVHAHKVKAPTALMLGSGDKRVPYYQGLEYYHRVVLNTDARLFLYEDNHSLSSLPVEMDSLINGALWFMKYTEKQT